MATKRKRENGDWVLRARVKPSVKKRVTEYVSAQKSDEITEASTVRDAVKEYLDRRQKQTA